MNSEMTKIVGAKGLGKLCVPPPGFLVGDMMYVPLLPALPILPAFFISGPGPLAEGGRCVAKGGVRAPVW